MRGVRGVAGGAEAELQAGGFQSGGASLGATAAPAREDAVGAEAGGFRAARSLDGGEGVRVDDDRERAGIYGELLPVVRRTEDRPGMRGGVQPGGGGAEAENQTLCGGEAAQPGGGGEAAGDAAAGQLGAGQAGLRVLPGTPADGGAAAEPAATALGADRRGWGVGALAGGGRAGTTAGGGVGGNP